jgi:hypothetical protein
MKRIAFALAGLGLMATGLRAEEKEKVEVKKDKNEVQIEKKRASGNTAKKTKVHSKARSRAGGGTVASTETTVERDRPGMANDSKAKTTEVKEKDAKGDVVREEKTVKH